MNRNRALLAWMFIAGAALVTVPVDAAAADAPTDLDRDGLPDSWERRFFGNIDQGPADDFDRDGLSNLDEFLIDSDPSDPLSSFAIRTFKKRGDRVSIDFLTGPGDRVYRVQESPDLRRWTNVFDGSLVRAEDVVRVEVPTLGDGTRYYRLAVATPENGPGTFHSETYPTFAEWKVAVDRLPSNLALNGAAPPNDLLPLKTWAEIEETIDAFFDLSIRGPLSDPLSWVGSIPSRNTFFDPGRSYFTVPPIPFEPFVRKLDVPAGSRAVFHGDFHGDIRSLIAQIDWLNQQGHMDGFRIVEPEFYLIYLGDYTDRGKYGIEVVYTLLRLKLANPDRVFLSRGNHEDFLLTRAYGFERELLGKYGDGFHYAKYWRVYDFLPVAIYFGSSGNYLLCCHGGVEPGFAAGPLLDATPRQCQQLLGPLLRGQFAMNHPGVLDSVAAFAASHVRDHLVDYQPVSPTSPRNIGFMWNDFYLAAGEPGLGFTPGRGFIFGRRPTEMVLDHYSTDRSRVRAVFRAHQHSSGSNPMMRRLLASNGAFRHWQETDSTDQFLASVADLSEVLDRREIRPVPDGSVWTFNVAPDSVYGRGLNYRFDTFGILETAEAFSDWKLQIVNLLISQE